MVTVSNVLEEVSQHFKDADWLNEHADILHETLTQALENEQTVNDAIGSILLIFPYLLNREDLKRWGQLLNLALKRSKIPLMDKIDKSSNRDTYRVGDVYTLTRLPPPAQVGKRKRRHRDRPDQREMFEIYLALLMSQVNNQSETFIREEIDGVLNFGRWVNDANLYHKLYQTLAFIYNQTGEFDRALDYARLAYTYWSRQDSSDPVDILETALSAYAMATAYHGKVQINYALEWIERASDLFAKIDYPMQYGVIAEERGALHLRDADYEAAIQWFQIALQELDPVNAKFHVALTLHYLGMAQGYMGDCDNGIANLERSLDLWEELDNKRQQEHTEHTLAYIEAKMGYTDEALARLERCVEMANQLPESAFKTFLEDLIHRLHEAIETANLGKLSRPGD